jgi:hypothetical protein
VLAAAERLTDLETLLTTYANASRSEQPQIGTNIVAEIRGENATGNSPPWQNDRCLLPVIYAARILAIWQSKLQRRIFTVRRSPLSIVKPRQLLSSILLLGSAWLAAYGCFWLLPNVFEPWNAQTVDQFFVLRALEHLWPPMTARWYGDLK